MKSNLEDFRFMLRKHKLGETAEVVVIRDGKPITVAFTLEIPH